MSDMKSEVPPGWRLKRIGEMARVVTGATPRAANPEYLGEAIPFLTPSDIPGRQKNVTTGRLLSQAGAAAFSPKLIPKGTPCFVAIGSTIGKTCVAPAQALTNQQIHATIPKSSVADSDFLYYALSQHAEMLRQIAGGSATPILKKTAFEKYAIAVPPLDEQRRVASVLSALDDKIESNRRLAKTLEEIAVAQFKARFVDFVGHDDLVEGEMGLIPRGWSTTPVGQIARFVNGKAFTKFGNGRGRMVVRIADLRSGPGASTVYSDYETSSDFMAAPGDILFAWSGSLDVYRWHRSEALINQHIFKVIPEGYPGWFVFLALKHVMPHFQAIAADMATTMGHIKRADLHAFSVAVPPAPSLRKHNSVFFPLFERALAARTEAVTLTMVRDQLLPCLISGSLRVNRERAP
jgi:type I restriction enzyme S subunit